MASHAQNPSVPIVFQFDQNEIRTLTINQEPWFVAIDICKTLDYSDSAQALRNLDEEEKQTLHNMQGLTASRNGILTLINESGLYSLILSSRKPEARRFKKWVTAEVLPTIRKTGRYDIQDKTTRATPLEAARLFRPFFSIARCIGCDRNAAAISANQAVKKIAGHNLLALLDQTHLKADNQQSAWFTPTQLGKRIGLSPRAFNKCLAASGLQIRQADSWMPTHTAQGLARVFDTGKYTGQGTPVTQIKWVHTVLDKLHVTAPEASHDTRH